MNKVQVFDSALLAVLVAFSGAAFSMYVAVPTALLGVVCIFGRRRPRAVSQDVRPGQQDALDDLDDPIDARSVANSYHRLLRRD